MSDMNSGSSYWHNLQLVLTGLASGRLCCSTFLYRTPAGLALSQLLYSVFILSNPVITLETYSVVGEEHYNIFRSGQLVVPAGLWFCSCFSHLPSCAVCLLFLFPPQQHMHTGSAAVIIAGLECRADRWTVFVQNASVCQTWLIELRPQPKTARSSEQHRNALGTGETRSHTFVHAQTYAAYLYVCIHMQRHACADRG